MNHLQNLALPHPTNPHVRSLFSLTESPAILPFVLFTPYPNKYTFCVQQFKRTSSSIPSLHTVICHTFHSETEKYSALLMLCVLTICKNDNINLLDVKLLILAEFQPNRPNIGR